MTDNAMPLSKVVEIIEIALKKNVDATITIKSEHNSNEVSSINVEYFLS